MKEHPSLRKIEGEVLRLSDKLKEEKKMDSTKYKTIEALKSINYKEVITRALWTFLQVFLAVFITAGDTIINSLFAGDWAGLQALMITTSLSAVAAGLSAVKTIVVEVINGLKKAI